VSNFSELHERVNHKDVSLDLLSDKDVEKIWSSVRLKGGHTDMIKILRAEMNNVIEQRLTRKTCSVMSEHKIDGLKHIETTFKVHTEFNDEDDHVLFYASKVIPFRVQGCARSHPSMHSNFCRDCGKRLRGG